MNDHRDFRRYLRFARLAGETFDAARDVRTSRTTAPGATAAIEPLDELVREIGPTVQQMRSRGADADEIRRLLAGWVH